MDLQPGATPHHVIRPPECWCHTPGKVPAVLTILRAEQITPDTLEVECHCNRVFQFRFPRPIGFRMQSESQSTHNRK